ncbi:sensor histidine kinase [Streptomyces sp. JH002]|uniref:sensor histidine kinase n=1 Tax=Streptomyces sp. JH002 TaxID=2763259 RepID=UPI003D8044BF
MHTTPGPPAPPSLLRRVPPGLWLVLLWLAVTTYTLVMDSRMMDPWHFVFGGPRSRMTGWPMLTAAGVLVAAAGLLTRRTLLALALLLSGTVVTTTGISVKDIPLLQFLPVIVALCYIAATRPRRTSAVAGAMALGVLIGYALTRSLLGMPVEVSTAATVVLTTVVAWLIGNSIRQSQLHEEALRARAAEAAVTAERLRIARELHDMVAHSVGIIAFQAGMGGRVIDTRPAEARRALGAIEATSRETLSGLRRMLGTLRRPVALEPAPGLADLDRLVATAGAAGVRVEVRRLGEPRPLPGDIELSAFRIVQEALTNVVRHARTDHCRVTVGFGEADLSVEITDEGRGPGDGRAAGYGIVGMRERAALLGGSLTAGARPGGGYRVTATLPVPAPVAAAVR